MPTITTYPFALRVIEGPWPANIPADAAVFYASRPLNGTPFDHRAMQFVGRSWLDLDDTYAARHLEVNYSQDACVCSFMTVETMATAVRGHFDQQYDAAHVLSVYPDTNAGRADLAKEYFRIFPRVVTYAANEDGTIRLATIETFDSIEDRKAAAKNIGRRISGI